MRWMENVLFCHHFSSLLLKFLILFSLISVVFHSHSEHFFKILLQATEDLTQLLKKLRKGSMCGLCLRSNALAQQTENRASYSYLRDKKPKVASFWFSEVKTQLDVLYIPSTCEVFPIHYKYMIYLFSKFSLLLTTTSHHFLPC